ncbi:hypothetical protein IVB15_24825 [Bradyrhizobium sp. 182]|nr:hypothetical protein [Bradyrhizobium sp. 182]
MTDVAEKCPVAIRAVLPFVFRQWPLQPYRSILLLVGFLAAFGAIIALGLVSVILRFTALQAIFRSRSRLLRMWFVRRLCASSDSRPIGEPTLSPIRT